MFMSHAFKLTTRANIFCAALWLAATVAVVALLLRLHPFAYLIFLLLLLFVALVVLFSCIRSDIFIRFHAVYLHDVACLCLHGFSAHRTEYNEQMTLFGSSSFLRVQRI